MKKSIRLRPLRRKRVSPKAYLRLSKAEKTNIADTRFVYPKIGDSGFGYFEITFKRPVYQKIA